MDIYLLKPSVLRPRGGASVRRWIMDAVIQMLARTLRDSHSLLLRLLPINLAMRLLQPISLHMLIPK